MIYTSYFSNIKNILATRPNMRFFSIAGKTPDWFLELNKNGKNIAFKFSILAPRYEWWKEWHDKFENALDDEDSVLWYTTKYNETVLNDLEPTLIADKLNKLANGNDVCLLCYEANEKFCHRHLVANWFNTANIECSELFEDAVLTKEKILSIGQLESIDHKRLLLNDNYVCEFVVPAHIENQQSYHFFTSWFKDANCPRMTSYADVIVYDYSKFKKLIGRLYIHNDKDLDNKYSIELFTRNEKEKKWNSMISINLAVIEELPVSVSSFIKLIKFSPLHKISEPYDSLGLTICEFKEHNKMQPNIEIGIDGRLYYEIVDMSSYNEGSVIPINSHHRKDVIAYEKLSYDNAQSLANRINASLEKLYSI